MTVNCIFRTGFSLCLLALALVMSGCAENQSSIDLNADGGASLTIYVPAVLQTRALDPDQLDPNVTINDVRVPVSKPNTGTFWTGATTAEKFSNVKFNIEWKENLSDGTQLLLARATKTHNNIVENITFRVEEYITTGNDFDFDGDGISNLEERKRDLNPLIADVVTNGVDPDVQIFGTGRSTKIDGKRGENDTFWDFATYTDVNSKKLAINNMIRDDNANVQEDPNASYQWAAIHDGTYLTLFVWGKALNGSSIKVNGDSGVDFFNDDSVEIFIDGDLSQREDAYDTVDDMLINIPLARGAGPVYEENNSSAANKRIYRGKSVSDEVDFDVQNPALVEFGTCFCFGADRTTWEIRIDMAAAQIPIGRTFGFEVQINTDDDGGQRDAKYAWAKDARKPGESSNLADITWRYPVHMGKARLIPF